MSVGSRIRAIRLQEKIDKNKEFSNKIGVLVEMKNKGVDNKENKNKNNI